ncbi:hypothetical protein VOLCADRAFT_107854 [Volvox carteri f. nagariensis]|uniref:Uncharacterized protein n=1 Tax=Volvox carteri f. nagariensis TaxID=3068 RepID=D8UGV5_VOLCA|nr:uncharacterized protein VOLCADRAFT_107854 [Volvox carteri f. nagariensis]EFJ41046.1 hypothetical protein VOLCADRAFT_107854 [Volvox carteri f. nagariensis]|eukprot:XP_002957910.1 hypothetical protein VOLCADRAFT_107854 [Volvox carteri f. nagariensis]
MGKNSKGSGGSAGATSKAHTPSGGHGTNKKGSGGAAAAMASGSGNAAAAVAGGSYSLEIREGCVALMRFRSRDSMNSLLDPISNAMEGVIANRLGHNFALIDTARDHVAFRKACGLPKQVKYVIATLEGDAHSIRHEMCHARYYLDPSYRDTVMQVWSRSLASAQRDAITAFLNRLKYDTVAHVDEFQAYLVTEKSNFFGMDLTEAQQQLQASFPTGSWR